MQIKTTVSLKRISDLLCSALEGGSNYWYEIVEQIKPPKLEFRSNPDLGDGNFPHIDYPLNKGGALIIRSLEEPRKHAKRLDLASIERGLTLWANSTDYAHHWGDFLKENDDAITGDVFLQFCLFGEVLYG